MATLRAYIFPLILCVFLPLHVFAQPAPTAGESGGHGNFDAIAQDIDSQVMSPFCPGRTLSACPSPQARELRDQIRQWLQQGESQHEIRARLVSIYGDEILGVPSGSAFGTIGWVAPVVFVVLFLLAVFYAMRKMRRERAAQAVPAANVSDDVKLQIEREVKERLESTNH